MKVKLIVIAMLLIAVLGTMLVMPATAATATRTLPGDCVNASENFTVTIEADNYGSFGAVIETLCAGWEYQSTTADDVQVDGNTISFMIVGIGPKTFTYTVLAPNATGTCCNISGIIRDDDTQDYTVTGTTEVCVCGDLPDPISATRDISDQTVEPGSMFTVTLTLTANRDLQAPTLDENLPEGWAVTAVLNSGATYKESTNEWIWTTAMPRGETKIVIYNVIVPADATPQDYNITGQASAYDVSPVAIGGESTVTVESGTTVDPISATRDISDQTVEAGSTFTVTLTLTANEDIQAPTLDEALPSGWNVTEVDNGGATYKPSTTEWVWSAAMSSGETKTVAYNVTVPAGATPQDYNIAGQASAYEVSPVAIGGESTVTVESGTTVDPISATRDISDQTVEAGSTFTVTLTLTANEDLQAPTLDEALPSGWNVTEVDSGGATYKAATTEWIWTAAMPIGEAKIVTYNVTVPADATPQSYDITGQASAYEVSPVAIGGESTVTVTPVCDRCLGTCYEGTVCEGNPINGKMSCSECLAVAGRSWLNDPCPASDCGCTCDSMCWNDSIGGCPECCDGIDNDGVNGTDWPADPQCGCCIDGNETDGTDPCPTPCVPEMPTIVLGAIGILGVALLARKRE